ncbi:hypothetical protein MHU86_14883 [Fragilaria crotonensis]|nr:hypothetical protein MHU86_14883 [Fragilaria crotonensis]
MAHLCEFATSWNPTEISSRRSNGTRAPSSSNGTSQVLCQIPASLGKRSRRSRAVLIFHEVYSSSKLQHVKEDGDQQHYTRQPSTNVHLLESNSEPSGVEVIEPDKPLRKFLAAATLLVPGTAPHCTESANRMSVDELKLFPSSTELASAATSRSMEALVAWYQRLRELIEFERLYGHQNVPQKSHSFPKLGTWVNKQRYHRHELTSEKVAVLEAVCFDWGEKLGETRWRMRYKALVAYRTKNGDCRVPTRWEDDRKLGRWVSLQRCQYKDFMSGRKTVMTKERIEMLQDLGFEWEISSRGFYHYKKGVSSQN